MGCKLRKAFPIFLFLVISLFAVIQEVKAAYTFEDGFESGNFSAWTGQVSSPAVTTDRPHHGTYSMESSASAECTYKTLSAAQEYYYRVYAQYNNAFGSSGNEMRAVTAYDSSASRVLASVSFYRSGANMVFRLYYYDTSAKTTTGGGPHSADTWYCIELYVKCESGSNDGVYTVWVDGTQIISLASMNTVSTTQDRFYAGWHGGACTGNTEWVDCCVANTAYIGLEVTGNYSYSFSNTTGITSTLVIWQEKGFLSSQTTVTTTPLGFGIESIFLTSPQTVQSSTALLLGIARQWLLTATTQTSTALLIGMERLMGLTATTSTFSFISYGTELVGAFTQIITETVGSSSALTVFLERVWGFTSTSTVISFYSLGLELAGTFAQTITETISGSSTLTILLERQWGFTETITVISFFVHGIEIEGLFQQIITEVVKATSTMAAFLETLAIPTPTELKYAFLLFGVGVGFLLAMIFILGKRDRDEDEESEP